MSISSETYRAHHQSLQSFTSDYSDADQSVGLSEDDPEEEESMEDILDRRLGWRAIFLLPFENLWQTCIMVMGLLSSGIAIFMLSHSGMPAETKARLNAINAVFDVMCAIDNVLVICCKMMHGLRIPYIHPRRPNSIIWMEFISLLPGEAIFGIKENERHYYVFKLRKLLKLLRIRFFFFYHQHIMIRYRPLLVFVTQLFSTLVSGLLIGYSMYYSMLCVFDPQYCNDDDAIMILCSVSSVLTFNGFAYIEHYEDRALKVAAFTICASLYTFFQIAALSLGILVATLLSINQHKYLYDFKLKCVELQLDQLDVSADNKKKVYDFYNVYWNKKRGYNMESKKEVFTEIVSGGMWREITTDVNWYALKHSKLFQNMDLPFLRCLALVMRQTFVLPGEILYHKNKDKHEMLYIVSGTIEVLSDEDGETPIISFSAGTCLGECSLFKTYRSTVIVKCKEFAEIHVLRRNDFIKVTMNFPKQYQKLKKTVANRIRFALTERKISQHVIKEQGIEKSQQLTIMWIKNTLHRLMMKDGEFSARHECQNIFLREELSHARFFKIPFSAKHLELLSITERLNVTSDAVFLKYDFPWIFQQQSVILHVWDVFMAFVTIFTSYTYPYYALVQSNHPEWFLPVNYSILLFYWLDIYIQVTTAVQTRDEVIEDIKLIALKRLEEFYFWVDIVAAFPVQTSSCFIVKHSTDQTRACLKLNRILKFLKLKKLFERYEESTEGYSDLISVFKYMNFLVYIAYLMSCLLYALHCFDDSCSLNGRNRPEMLSLFFFDVIQLVTGKGTPESDNLTDYYVLYVVIMYTSLISYVIIIGNYGYKCILRGLGKSQLISSVVDINSVLETHGLPKQYQRRVTEYIMSQWFWDRAQAILFQGDTLSELPNFIYKSIKEDAIANKLREIPIFQELPEDIICELCVVTHQHMLPPNEVICYGGAADDTFHYILDGYCEVISPLTKKREKIVGPKDSINVIEVCMSLPVINTTVTLTNCVILSLNVRKIKSIFTSYPEHYLVLKQACDDEETRKNFMALLDRASDSIHYSLETERDGSRSFRFFGFRLQVDSEEEYDYFVPFDRLGVFSWINVILVRFTIMPFGWFIFTWETVRAVCAVFSSLLFLIAPIGTCTDCGWRPFLLFLDVTAWCDIYVRLHVCYYDDKGILISHPLKTAVHYIKHGLLLDLLGAFPMEIVMPARLRKFSALLRWNRLLQLHRFMGLFHLMNHKYLIPYKSLFMVKYFILLVVICNGSAALVSNIICDFGQHIEASSDYTAGVRCKQGSMFSASNFTKPLDPLQVHLISAYFTTGFLTCGMRGLLAQNYMEEFYEALLSLLGFIIIIHLSGEMISSSAILHNALIYYQMSLKSAKLFMSSNKIRLSIQKRLIQHVELKWKIKRGRDIHLLLKNYSRALSEDLIYATYGAVLEQHSVFSEGSKGFYRSLLLEATHDIICHEGHVAYLNDVKTRLHIIYKGRIDVIAPDGTKLITLGAGSMCGNLDDCRTVRQTVGLVAHGHVELISIEAVRFHEILRNYHNLNKKFKMLTAIHIDYIQGRHAKKVDTYETDSVSASYQESSGPEIQHSKLIAKIKLTVFEPYSKKMFAWKCFKLVVVCFLVAVLDIYVLAVREFSVPLVVFRYACDLCYALDYIYIRYHTAYEDEIGIMIRDVGMIREHEHQQKLYRWLSICSLFPLDLIAWVLPVSSNTRYYIFNWLRINRLLRVHYIPRYFKMYTNKIDVNLYMIQVGSLIFLIVTYIHVVTCFLLLISCTHSPNLLPPVQCDVLHDGNDSWHKLKIYLKYFCVIVSCFTRITQWQYPQSKVLLLFFILLMVSNVIIATKVISGVCSMLQMESFLKSEYEQVCEHLMFFLQSEQVSKSLMAKVWNYLCLLWKRQRGTVFPTLLAEAPSTLRSTVVSAAFSHHITKNYIFKKCHEDFRRQLLIYVKTLVFFDGEYIVFKGDINESMYFIHEGAVLILTEDMTYKEDAIGKLVMGQSFGILQGLLPLTPHVYSFRSCATTTVLKLERYLWYHLLDFFPASKEVIFEATANYTGY